MKKADVVELVQDDLLPLFNKERQHLDTIDGWMRWTPADIVTQRRDNKEAAYLKSLSKTPWARLVIAATAQALSVEGIHAADKQADELHKSWLPWDRNDMETKQGALHRAALGYGMAYTTVLPGIPGAVINGYSPRDFIATYGDEVEDEFPLYGMRVISQGRGRSRLFRVLDEDAVYFLAEKDGFGGDIEFIDTQIHGMGVSPVVRYANELDLEGRAPGEVEPLIPLFARINKTDYDRLLTQHFNSWKVRTATGLAKPESKEDADKEKLRLAQDDILVGEEDVEFGTLDETSLEPFVKAHDSDIEALAAVSQTPTTAFGKLINVSAEGLQEARQSLRAKVKDRKKAFGGSHMRTLRLSAWAEGRDEDAADFTLKAKWADDDSTYLASAVDALGKAATMLGVPPQLLWDRIPNVDETTARTWRQYANENPSAEERQADALAAAFLDGK